MDNVVILYHAYEDLIMAFTDPIKPEQWNILLRLTDDMSRLALLRALGYQAFTYDFIWRTNTHIIESLITCISKAQIDS